MNTVFAICESILGDDAPECYDTDLAMNEIDSKDIYMATGTPTFSVAYNSCTCNYPDINCIPITSVEIGKVC